MKIRIGNFSQKAHPILSWFVMTCCIVTVGLLYVMQKAEVAADSLDDAAGYSTYLN